MQGYFCQWKYSHTTSSGTKLDSALLCMSGIWNFRQGRIFRKILLPCYTQKQVVLQKPAKAVMCLDSACLTTPITTFCLSMLTDLIFFVQIMCYLPLLQEGTTAWFPTLGTSHNRPWLSGNVCLPIMYNGLQKLLHKFSVVRAEPACDGVI